MITFTEPYLLFQFLRKTNRTMKVAGAVFCLLLNSSCLGLNTNFGVNNVLEVFGYNSNDINDRPEDLNVEDAESGPPPHDQTAR